MVTANVSRDRFLCPACGGSGLISSHRSLVAFARVKCSECGGDKTVSDQQFTVLTERKRRDGWMATWSIYVAVVMAAAARVSV